MNVAYIQAAGFFCDQLLTAILNCETFTDSQKQGMNGLLYKLKQIKDAAVAKGCVPEGEPMKAEEGRKEYSINEENFWYFLEPPEGEAKGLRPHYHGVAGPTVADLKAALTMAADVLGQVQAKCDDGTFAKITEIEQKVVAAAKDGSLKRFAETAAKWKDKDFVLSVLARFL